MGVLNLIADYRREVKSEIQSIEDKISHIEAMMAAFLTKLTKYEVAHSVADSGYSWAKDGDQRDEDRLLWVTMDPCAFYIVKKVFLSFTKLDFTQYHLHNKNKMCFMKLWSNYSFYKRLFPVFYKMYRSALQYMNKHNIQYAALN